MSNHYATSLLVEQHHAELRNEAAQDHLARLARLGGPRRTHWWERLMRFRVHAHRPTATVAAGDSPC
ncbi:MAG TPA: hypothetical protein VIT65_11345 [Microlunatus sp.]